VSNSPGELPTVFTHHTVYAAHDPSQRQIAAVLARLDENIGSVRGELTPGDLCAIALSMAQITVIGDRY
jgi:hypothetical protein